VTSEGPEAVAAPTDAPARQPRQSWRARAIANASAAAADPASSHVRLWVLCFLFANSRTVNRALAGNPATGERTLSRVVHRSLRRGQWNIAVIAIEHPRCTVSLFRWLVWSSFPAVEVAVARNPRASSVLMERLTNGYPEPRFRVHVATNPAAPPEVIDRLLSDRDPYVRCVAATHPAATPAGLRRLCQDMSQPAWTLRAAATNPACPADLADQLLTWLALGGAGASDPHFDPITCTGNPGSTEVHPAAWYANAARQQRAETHALWRVRAAIPMSRPRILISVLKVLALDPQVEVRRQAARFRALPVATLRELRFDTDPGVARLAEVALKDRPRDLRKRLRIRSPRRRLVGALVVVGGLLLINFQRFVSPLPLPPAPGFNAVTLDDGLSLPAAVAMHRSVSGGGEIASGMISGYSNLPAMPFISVVAGSVPLAVTVPGAFTTGQVIVIQSGPLQVPAHHHTVVVMPTDPTSVTVTVGVPNQVPDTLFFSFNS